MKFEIAETNGGAISLEIGGTRINLYNDLKDVFKDLEIILKLHFKTGAYGKDKTK